MDDQTVTQPSNHFEARLQQIEARVLQRDRRVPPWTFLRIVAGAAMVLAIMTIVITLGIIAGREVVQYGLIVVVALLMLVTLLLHRWGRLKVRVPGSENSDI